jgi:transposase
MAKRPGQPTKYRPEYCEQLIEHMRQLHSFESFAANIGTHRDTLYAWCKEHPEFSDAKKQGRAVMLKGMENVGKGLFTGKIKGNVSAWIFYMKNTTGWRDEPVEEAEGIDGISFDYED